MDSRAMATLIRLDYCFITDLSGVVNMDSRTSELKQTREGVGTDPTYKGQL